ncbi:MAG: hypothetical protein IPL46_14245 [Saprospiraceae bacterium]|nr:hypothetical protein [Saprospiraceae bacterium]
MTRFRNFLITTFIGGFVVLLPLAIFFLLIKLLIDIVIGLLSPLTNLIKNEFNLPVPEYLVSSLAVAIIVVICFLIGLTIKTQVGRRSFRHIERTYLLRLPSMVSLRKPCSNLPARKKCHFLM